MEKLNFKREIKSPEWGELDVDLLAAEMFNYLDGLQAIDFLGAKFKNFHSEAMFEHQATKRSLCLISQTPRNERLLLSVGKEADFEIYIIRNFSKSSGLLSKARLQVCNPDLSADCRQVLTVDRGFDAKGALESQVLKVFSMRNGYCLFSKTQDKSMELDQAVETDRTRLCLYDPDGTPKLQAVCQSGEIRLNLERFKTVSSREIGSYILTRFEKFFGLRTNSRQSDKLSTQDFCQLNFFNRRFLPITLEHLRTTAEILGNSVEDYGLAETA